MPITKLYVEGDLEIQCLLPILLGKPVLLQGGSKNALKPRAGTDRRENSVAAGYLRDRDFDFDPPSDLTVPTLDSVFQNTGTPFGWRWCRHETENYLIDPALVSAAMGWSLVEVDKAILSAAACIKDYEVARWTIGVVRRQLPPNYDLRTRPDGLNEVDLPTDLRAETVKAWAARTISDHRTPMVAATEFATVQASLVHFNTTFDSEFLRSAANILVWFSGKDLLAAMSGWLAVKGIANPGAFRAQLRDWVIANPTRTVELLPEWNELANQLRS